LICQNRYHEANMPRCVSSFEEELEELLREPVGDGHQRELTTFDRYAGPHEGRLVLFGAGRLGRKMLAELPGTGLRAVAFSDNNPALWGTKIDGLPVLQPAEAAATHGRTAAFVVCIFAAETVGTMEERICQLQGLGCETVVSFVPLLWKLNGALLPHWVVDLPTRVLERADDVRRCAGLMSDERSRKEFLAQVRWRLYGDFSVLPAPESGPQYFASECFSLSEHEVFIDCGAFDGDTLRVFLDESHGHFQRAVCFEPDPSNFAKLEAYVGSLPEPVRNRIEARQFAVGSSERVASFEAAGDTSSTLGSGSIEVNCVSLDGFVGGARASFLKFDIEGAEPDALAGAGHTISRQSPVLAVCAYHRPGHLWELPLLIDKIRPGYHHFLRPYKQVWELVCYAVPEDRVPS
jgi:FkbM family methyltransferase